MAFTNLEEIFYLVVLILAIAYILSGYIKSPKKSYRQLRKRSFFDWEDFKFAAVVAVPAILFHELAHKFAAIAFGAAATFKIWGFGLILGVFLRLIYSPFLLLAPGYVEISSEILSSSQMGIIAFAGPLVNLILWLVPTFILRIKKGKLKKNTAIFLFYTAFLNMWLFIFNMIPIPPLDGSKVLYGIISIFS
ncbi:MAG: site-2 protease family protein [Nanoarchaeota archaeon]|nr:site-2 protease family protein [Nanoarchaeota archaeon]